MASYAQLAYERVEAIRRLQQMIDDQSAESVLQNVIAEAPWLIEPTWTPITVNQGLKLFLQRFEKYYQDRSGEDVTLAIRHVNKRPDFTLIHMGRKLHIVELKAVGHLFGNEDWDRLHNYLEAFSEFFGNNKHLAGEFQDGWIVDLVCDKVHITERNMKLAYQYWRDQEGRIERISWDDFLARAVKANEEFLNAHDQVRDQAAQLSTERTEQ